MERDIILVRSGCLMASIAGNIPGGPSGQEAEDTSRDDKVHEERVEHGELSRSLHEALQRIAEYEVLLREADHRVKNSLQLVASMLALEARRSGDGAASNTLRQAGRRILSIASVHEQLYRFSDKEHIDLGAFLQGLGESLILNKPDNVTGVVVEAVPVVARPEFAMKLGLLVCELVTNAFKHAYALESRGEVRVRLTESSDGWRLIVEDDGVGLSSDFIDNSARGFGIVLLRSVLAQLDGRMEIGEGAGATVVIDLPRQPIRPSHAEN